MKKNESITKIMSTDVKTVHIGQKISDVRHIICESEIDHVPVLDGTKLAGLISATDLMKLNVVINGADEHSIDAMIDQQFTIKEIMNTNITSIKEVETIRQATHILTKGKFHCVPVVNDSNEVVGIVTMTDLIRYLDAQY
ncbi:CBS domain-containing protein [Marinicellulosiphila megalodicopiae]|uniref:CBS domain-containing protein n=1 Tax=Marinicellulosiphila megalodicopiae TaxID=2724896 RepID=UPI003BB1D5AA